MFIPPKVKTSNTYTPSGFLIEVFGRSNPIPTAQRFHFSDAQSKLQFEATHMGFLTVEGYFESFEGWATLSNDKSSVTAAQLTIHSKSITTDNSLRDKSLRSEDFLNAQEFPEITFESSQSPSNDQSNTLTGYLNLKGRRSPINISYEVKKNTKGIFEINGKALLSRKALDLQLGQMDGLVSDEVLAEFIILLH
ncbi:MAG: YceI family protein [Bacteroidota bacterium]